MLERFLAQQFQLGLICPKDFPIWANNVKRDGGVLKKILKISEPIRTRILNLQGA
jgi:hypothetical protein